MLAVRKKKPFECAISMVRAVQLVRHNEYWPISSEITTVNSQSDLRILL